MIICTIVLAAMGALVSMLSMDLVLTSCYGMLKTFLAALLLLWGIDGRVGSLVPAGNDCMIA